MGVVVTVMNMKGGVGKTTVTAHLVSRLSNIDYYFTVGDLQEVMLRWHDQSSGYRLKQRS